MGIWKLFAGSRRSGGGGDGSSRERGNESEDRFAEAGKVLVARNPFFTDYISCGKIFVFDSRKMDSVTPTRSGAAIPLQVKSSKEGARIHYEGGWRIKNGKGRWFKPCKNILAMWPHDSEGRKETAEEISYRMEKNFYEILAHPELTPYDLYLKEKSENPK